MLTSGYILLFFLEACYGNALTNKTKSCVEYRIQDTRWNQTILDIVENITEGNCLMQCVRDEHCMAYNMWHGNGTCELLPRVECHETEKRKGYTFVSLGVCTLGVPWTIQRSSGVAESSCLRWQYYDYTSECPNTFVRTPVGDSCVALVPHKGLHLPGWYHPDMFRFATLDECPAKCISGYLLQDVSTCNVVWRDYTAGDLVPERAVVGGTWKDGTPLYIMADIIQGRWAVGYYQPNVKRSFIMRVDNVHDPKNMKILIFD